MSISERPNVFPWPPVLLVTSFAAALALGVWLPLPWPPSPIRELFAVIGVMLCAAALLIDVMAVLTLRKAKTTFLPHRGSDHLVTSGPFSFSRNPIYLGNVLLLFGAGLFFGNLWFWVIALIDGALTQRLAIMREEAHLAARFPAGWRGYAKKVRRWI